MFKVNNKDTKTTRVALFGVFILNFEHISHYCSSAFIVNFEHVIAGWVNKTQIQNPAKQKAVFAKHSILDVWQSPEFSEFRIFYRQL